MVDLILLMYEMLFAVGESAKLQQFQSASSNFDNLVLYATIKIINNSGQSQQATSMRRNSHSLILRKANKKQYYVNQQTDQSFAYIGSQESNLAKRQNNFIQMNKKNLKNFFKDRIPRDKCVLGVKTPIFMPAKVFQMRRQLCQKQESTQIVMKESFQLEQMPRNCESKRMEEYFQPGRREFSPGKKSPHASRTNFKNAQSSMSHYQMPTSSSFKKRCQTAKNKAYDSVFGTRNASCSLVDATNLNKTTFSGINKSNNSKLRSKTLQNDRQLEVPARDDKIKRIINRLEGFAAKINPNRGRIPDRSKVVYPNPEQTSSRKVLRLVEEATRHQRERNEEAQHIRTIEDINKIDPRFYAEMKRHKKTRLSSRNQILYNMLSTQGQHLQINQRIQKYHDQYRQQDRQLDSITNSDQSISRLKETPEDESEQAPPQNLFRVHYMTMKQKLSYFASCFIRAYDLTKLYGIRQDNIYNTLWRRRNPYQIQGSYAFFKFIKNGQAVKVERFLQENPEYAHQIDERRRTCLMVALQKNNISIMQSILRTGVNVDARNELKETALYCALKLNNQQAVELLLKFGAYPWSTKFFSINEALQKCSESISTLIKNARRLHLGRKFIKKMEQKRQFWNKNKSKIQGQELIIF